MSDRGSDWESDPGADPVRRLVVGGVSGSGKSTVGAALAQRLGLPFCDGDDLHPAANVAKMRAGVPLDDADRAPWLRAVGAWLAAQQDGGVIACSALARRYRDLIRSVCPDARVVMLTGDEDLIARRQAARSQHFMPPSLMASQFATYQPIESDEPGLAVDVGGSVDDTVVTVVSALG